MEASSRIWTLAAVLLLALAGCAAPGDGPGNGNGIDDAEPVGSATVAPGTMAHMLLLLDAGTAPPGAQVTVLQDAGLDVQAPEALHQDAAGALAAWVPIQVPAGTAQGTHDVILRVEDGEGEGRTVSFTLQVEQSTQGFQEGEVAVLDLVLRTRDGTVDLTTRADVDASPLPRSDDYQPPQDAEPLPFQVSGMAGLPPELLTALQEADVGHTRTVELPELYGPDIEVVHEPREEPIEREGEAQRFMEAPREMAEMQGFIDEDTQEGDPIDLDGPFPYVVETLNETTLRIELDASVGDRFTLYEAWRDATEAVEITDEHVVFRTDPTVAEGQPFTWREEWPDATEVAAVDQETILLRHSPEVGTTYTVPIGNGATAQATVATVEEDSIIVEQDNPHPLAGATLLLDFTVVDRQEADAMMPPGAPPS